ncbi:helix-turn-helix transcriptional regulator [Virgisporangium aliadipatigenens]|uniref:Helix-turn-helix transcriptional regulator n=1 Tax=Virgisporangium aliadipatigenens TaxID=741659 RepID=A0A8J3YH78_9ACTN|nr:helix-turn-helix transcriptional regulator [Virgisporangium aliadipatigenens]GIJ44372.1 helix-turn-helix transcriptional regulator [Virgisporangium aliadipatigenens]
MRSSSVEREAVRDVENLCRMDLDSAQLQRRIGARLSRRLNADAFCFGTMDPSTLLVTGHVTEGIPPEAATAAAHNEYLVDDVLKFAALARADVRAGVLSVAVGGNPRRSHRYRALMPLIDARDELRATFVVGGLCWGGMSLYRGGRRPTFSAADAALLQRLSATIGAALRTAAHRPATGAARGPADAGVLVLDHDLRLVTANPAAQRWIEELGSSGLPIAVLDVAARAQKSAAYGRVRDRSGRWISVQASPLTGDRPASIAVLIAPAPTAEVIEILQLAYALTRSERAVLEQVISGASSRTIAGRLFITTATVQDHLKAIFAKVGVRSRGELVARMLDGGFRTVAAG